MLRKYLLFVTFLLANLANAELWPIWSWMPNDPTRSQNNYARNTVTDAAGNHYVVVANGSSDTSRPQYLAKLAPGGNIMWAKRIVGLDVLDDPWSGIIDLQPDNHGQLIVISRGGARRYTMETGQQTGAFLSPSMNTNPYRVTSTGTLLTYRSHPVLGPQVTSYDFTSGTQDIWFIVTSDVAWDYTVAAFADDDRLYRWTINSTNNGAEIHVGAYDLGARTCRWNTTSQLTAPSSLSQSTCALVNRNLVFWNGQSNLRMLLIDPTGSLAWSKVFTDHYFTDLLWFVPISDNMFDAVDGKHVRTLRSTDGYLLGDHTYSVQYTPDWYQATQYHLAFGTYSGYNTDVFERTTSSHVLNVPNATQSESGSAISKTLYSDRLVVSGFLSPNSQPNNVEGNLQVYRLSDGANIESSRYRLPALAAFSYTMLATSRDAASVIRLNVTGSDGSLSRFRIISPQGHAIYESENFSAGATTIAAWAGQRVFAVSVYDPVTLIVTTRIIDGSTGVLRWSDAFSSSNALGALAATEASGRLVLGYGTKYRVLDMASGALLQTIVTDATLSCRSLYIDPNGDFYAMHGAGELRKYLSNHSLRWQAVLTGGSTTDIAALTVAPDGFVVAIYKEGNGYTALRRVNATSGALGTVGRVSDATIYFITLQDNLKVLLTGRKTSGSRRCVLRYDTNSVARQWEYVENVDSTGFIAIGVDDGDQVGILVRTNPFSYYRLWSATGTLASATVNIERPASTSFGGTEPLGFLLSPRHPVVYRSTDSEVPSQNYVKAYADTLHIHPSELQVVLGEENGGGLGSLGNSDGQRLELLNDSFYDQVELVVRAVGTVPFHINARVRVEAYATRGGVAQVVWIGNSDGTTWTLLGSETASTSDSVREYPVPETVNLNGVNSLRARLAWRPINDDSPSQDGWLVGIDEFQWLLD